VTVFKILALIINLLVVAYLLYAKRLFGLRGGRRAERAEAERDSGWPALEAALPPPAPSAPTAEVVGAGPAPGRVVEARPTSVGTGMTGDRAESQAPRGEKDQTSRPD
jgi:hypothetical protein